MITEMANDDYFMYQYDVSSPEAKKYGSAAEYVKAKLGELSGKGIAVTDVYFFDHGTIAGQGGMSLGDDWYMNGGEGDESLSSFAQMLGGVLPVDATIHLRGCWGGRIAQVVADASGLRTTGWTGMVIFVDQKDEPDYSAGRDYRGEGTYVISTPGAKDPQTKTEYEGNYDPNHY